MGPQDVKIKTLGPSPKKLKVFWKRRQKGKTAMRAVELDNYYTWGLNKRQWEQRGKPGRGAQLHCLVRDDRGLNQVVV